MVGSIGYVNLPFFDLVNLITILLHYRRTYSKSYDLDFVHIHLIIDLLIIILELEMYVQLFAKNEVKELQSGALTRAITN